MDEAKSYKTAGAFRTALESRLQTRAREEATDLQRLRRQVAFDRFLARMFSKGPKAAYPWLLKGGYAMELRMRAARTTKDIDLTLHDGTRLSKDPGKRREEVRDMLQEAAATRFEDYFEFLVGEAREDLEGAPEGGSRYPVAGQMDGRDFARFHVDVGIGDEVLEPLDIVTGRDWLGFGGVAPPSIPVIRRSSNSPKSSTSIHCRAVSERTREPRTSSTWCCSSARENSTRRRRVQQSARRSRNAGRTWYPPSSIHRPRSGEGCLTPWRKSAVSR